MHGDKSTIELLIDCIIFPLQQGCRASGDTRLSDINRDLKLYLVKELSIQKPSGKYVHVMALACTVND